MAVAPPTPKPRRAVMIPLSIAASVLLIAGVALLVNRPPRPSPPVTTTVALRNEASAPAAVRTAATALVSVAPSAGGPAHDGMVLNPPTLVVTSDAETPGTDVVVTSQTGQHEGAVVVGHDPTSGVSVLSLDHAMTPTSPTLASTAAVGPVDEVTLRSSPQGRPSVGWAPSQVGPAQTAPLKDGSMIGELTPSSTIASSSGEVMVSPAGEVEAMSTPALGKNAFLPASVVEALATQMRDGAAPSHARLGITGATSPQGVKVDSVEADGAAAGILKAGDVITRFDAQPVSSMPLLLDDLYGAPAGSDAQITFERSGQQQQAALTLGKAP